MLDLRDPGGHAEVSTVDVALGLHDGVLTLTITDNGKGIETLTRTSGLDNMRHRAERHAGTVEFTRPESGGTHRVDNPGRRRAAVMISNPRVGLTVSVTAGASRQAQQPGCVVPGRAWPECSTHSS